MKKLNEVKKQRDQVSQEELLKAIAALEEIVMAKEPEDWAEEEGVPEEKLPRIVLREEKVKDKILRKLLANDGELTRSHLYRAVRGDRMGLAKFSRALQSLEDNREIAIVKNDTRGRGRPVEKISLLRRDL